MKIKSPHPSGVALVIVLGFLVLISVLVVAFFSSVTTELKASRNFASGVTTRQLAESATQVVMGQIREATTRTSAAWASQPGMIRTYRNGAGTPGEKADAFYKLYSSDKMVLSGGGLLSTFLDPANPDYAMDWDTKPALWVDLNSPVMVKNPGGNAAHTGSTVPRFPIIDPRAYAYPVSSRIKTDNLNRNIEGFWYGSDTAAPVTPAGLVAPGGTGADDQRLPMPVRWIYVLQDGTLTTPNDAAPGGDSTGTVAKWSAAGSDAYKMPTKANPIVGRIAFWSDDETSKVNLNTAGGYVDPSLDPNLQASGYDVTTYAGSYWDTPRFYTEFDRGMPYKESDTTRAGTPMPGGGGLAMCQLLQNEFQRYPGHPATTSLGLVFGPYLQTPSGPTVASPYLRSEQLYSILPRLGTTSIIGGSGAGQLAGSTKGGMVRIVPYDPRNATTGLGNQTAKDLQINPKGDRLYASVDELYYAADSPSPAIDAGFQRMSMDKWLQSSANPLPAGVAAISAENVDKMRFFLTAQSRAPELNLFGRPRISIWPVRFENGSATDKSGLNPFDNVILFCSTIGTDTAPPTTGRPNTMKAPSASQSPLQAGLTPSPSSVGPPYRYIFTRRELPPQAAATNGKLPTPVNTWTNTASWVKDIDQPRNKQLMVYLQQLTTMNIPGFGGNFATKYSNDGRDQILAEIFDYIRCANLQDTTSRTIGDTDAIKFTAKGLVIPSKPTYLQAGKTFSGFGRFPTINEVSLVFYYSGPGTTTPGGSIVDVDGTGFPKVRKMRAFLLVSTFNPMQGYAPTRDPEQADPKISFEISGLDAFKVAAGAVSGSLFPQATGSPSTTLYRSSGGTWGGRNFGGFEGFMHTLVGQNTAWAPNKIAEPGVGNLASPYSDGAAGTGKSVNALNQQEVYPYQTPKANELSIPTSQTTFMFTGGQINIKMLYGGQLVQTVSMEIPNSTTPWPVPRGDTGTTVDLKNGIKNGATTIDCTDLSSNKWATVNPAWTGGAAFVNEMKKYYWDAANNFYSATAHGGVAPGSPYSLQTQLDASWSFASRLAWSLQNSYSPQLNASKQIQNYYPNRWRMILQPGDTIRSVIYCNTPSGSGGGPTKTGDLRLALVPSVSGGNVTGYFPHPDYQTGYSRACALRLADGNLYFPAGGSPANVPAVAGDLLGAKEAAFGNHVLISAGRIPASRAEGNLPFGANNGANGGVTWVQRDDTKAGDFDSGIGSLPDGPYLNKPDEGNVIFAYLDTNTNEYRFPVPYFGTWSYESPGNTFTSPSRQMPSPGMFGSLPSRPLLNHGWETLCFSPVPAGDGHPGNVEPKDHLLLDLFQMPVVEPYPISEPFSTAGKVNLNYQIQPFNYIARSTALRAVLHPVRITAVPPVWYDKYKTGEANSGSTSGRDQYDVEKGQAKPLAANFRMILDRDYTIKGFDDYFDNGRTNPDNGFFKSASQICERYLYPYNSALQSDGAVKTWWGQQTLGGDNTREKPYVDIYPRVTTKSNTFTVHMRVQTLRQIPRATSADYARWEEGRDNILGEYRGSTTIERYIDPADPRFDPLNVDFVNPDDTNSATNLESIYRFRSVINKKFAPN